MNKKYERLYKWQKENRGKVAEYHRKWYEKWAPRNPDKVLALKEKARIRSNEYYHTNKVSCLRKMKEYAEMNKEKILIRQERYRRKKGVSPKKPTVYRGMLGRHIKRKYDISLEEYDKMVIEQLGCCKICGAQMLRPCVDHNHDTGEVRGILCIPCNLFLGIFEQIPEIIPNMYKYLNSELQRS